jgi:uncharacterized protein YgiM (DUF1202 family)
MTRVRFFSFLIALACLLVLTTAEVPAYAAAPAQEPSFPAQGTANTNANLRSGPGTTVEKVGGVKAGDVVDLVACNDGCTWYQLKGEQWISASLVDLVAAVRAAAPAVKPTVRPSATATARPAVPAAKPTASGKANLRSGPGQQYSVAGSASAGQVLDLVGRNADSTWYALRDGTWISATLVNNASRNLPVKTVAAAAQGIGVSRAKLQSIYEGLGFLFESTPLQDGRPRMMADQGSTIVELIGPPQELEVATVIAFIPNDDPDAVTEIIIHMLMLPKTVLPSWDAADWFADHLEIGVNDPSGSYEESITVDGRLVTLSIEQSMGMILFSIKPAR